MGRVESFIRGAAVSAQWRGDRGRRIEAARDEYQISMLAHGH